MKMNKKLVEQGAFLFRWRSFLPLLLIFPGIVAISDSAVIEQKYGDFYEDSWVLLGFIISMIGLAVRWVTVGFVPAGTSGRNTKSQRANHLNTDGMYSVCKNPLYLGNFVTILGILVSVKVWWLVLLGSLAYWLYIERIIATEENFLIETYGDEYTEWASRTPIFVPNFKLWQAPHMKFSLRTVLRREYNGFMAVCAAFFFTEMILDVFMEREVIPYWLMEDWPWTFLFVLGLVTFVTLRTLKRHTRLLRVEGR